VHTRTRIALDAALTLEPAEHAREGGKERAPTAVRHVAIARRDAGYSDPPAWSIALQISWPSCDRPVCPALRKPALRLFGSIITVVAQTQEPSRLKSVPRLRAGVLGDVQASAERIGAVLGKHRPGAATVNLRSAAFRANHPNIRTLSRLFAAATLECSDVRLGW
jgi:hypothetical protein